MSKMTTCQRIIVGVLGLIALCIVVDLTVLVGWYTLSDETNRTVVTTQPQIVTVQLPATIQSNIGQQAEANQETGDISKSVPPTNTPVPPTTTPVPLTDTPIPPTPTPISGPIPFEAEGDSLSLNPVLGWHPGGSPANGYDLTLVPGTLTLIVGPYTDQFRDDNSAPLIILPFKGNFETQVKVVFNGIRQYQHAGLGVRSTQDSNSWVRWTKTDGPGLSLMQNRQGKTTDIKPWISYSSDTIYFKIARRGVLFTFSYSSNGSNWIVVQKDYVFEMPTEVEIFLMAFSAKNDQGITAQFDDFMIVGK